MNPFLNTKFGNVDIEGRIENVDDFGRANNRPISMREVGDENTQEEVNGLFLRQPGRVPFATETKISVSLHTFNKSTDILHCWAIFATASRSIVNLLSAVVKLSIPDYGETLIYSRPPCRTDSSWR